MKMKMTANLPPEITDYLDIVERDIVPACKEQKLLAKMVRRVFLTENIYVDTEQLTKYMNLQKYFPFKLFAWEKFLFTLHNCTYITETAELRFPNMLMLVGRGSGKNGYLSFENFCLMTVINGVKNYHIDICATSESQAKISFDEIREDVLEEHADYMHKRFYWTKETIQHLKTGSRLRFRTNNSKTKDGERAGKVDFDEFHQYEDYKNVNVFMGGLGKKKHPRITYLTTDGYIRGGPLDELKATALDILENEQNDKGLLPFICRLDDEKEVENPDLWVKANPSLVHFPYLKTQMLSEWENCKTNPSLYSAFLTKRMNIPIGNKDTEITDWANILVTNREIPDLTGHSCVAGIDYMRTNDFLAVGLLFKDNDTRYWLTHSFVCRQSVDLPRIKAPINEWERMGLLTFIDDVNIHPDIPANWLWSMAVDYDIKWVGVDGFRYALLSSALEKVGFNAKGDYKNIKLVRPSNQEYIEPVINSMFLDENIIWGDNPLMRWYTGNVKKVISLHGNFRYEKIEPKSRKTDGFMALVNAMSCEDMLEAKKDPPPIMPPVIFD